MTERVHPDAPPRWVGYVMFIGNKQRGEDFPKATRNIDVEVQAEDLVLAVRRATVKARDVLPRGYKIRSVTVSLRRVA